jgi:hypothetical protein
MVAPFHGSGTAAPGSGTAAPGSLGDGDSDLRWRRCGVGDGGARLPRRGSWMAARIGDGGDRGFHGASRSGRGRLWSRGRERLPRREALPRFLDFPRLLPGILPGHEFGPLELDEIPGLNSVVGQTG